MILQTEPPAGNSATDDAAHLSYREKTNLGSFYTPLSVVQRVYDMLRRNLGTDSLDVILDNSCGYGAFFAVPTLQERARLVGADLDRGALSVARSNFPQATFVESNALTDIGRGKYGISPGERLVIVGNPPYNDVTSHVKNRVKAAPCEVDPSVRSRDLGLSFLLSFAQLEPDAIAVLHPLSYLIKEANFKVLRPMMRHYRLGDALVFNSREFSETSKLNGFPIVIALYVRDGRGTIYTDIVQRPFSTVEGASFRLADFDYVCRYISKYPARRTTDRTASGIRFYTMRDINALKRSRTFIPDDIPNAVHVAPEKLAYYCYVDAFKEHAGSLPYYFGNLDVFFDHAEFLKLQDDFVLLSALKHPQILPGRADHADEPQRESARLRVATYFDRLLAPYRRVHQA